MPLNAIDLILAGEQGLRQLFPLPIQQLDRIHWSPLNIIYKATEFLAYKKDIKILDIGSGCGKFCLAASYCKPSAVFTGVEQRLSLVEHAQRAKERSGRPNVNFIHGNFTQVDLRRFEGFYFYNSFFENVTGADKIDDTIAYSLELYRYYSRYLFRGLYDMPAGTRIATYCSWNDEIPPAYQLIESHFDGLLKFWMKM